jgi:hypothetical protein
MPDEFFTPVAELDAGDSRRRQRAILSVGRIYSASTSLWGKPTTRETWARLLDAMRLSEVLFSLPEAALGTPDFSHQFLRSESVSTMMSIDPGGWMPSRLKLSEASVVATLTTSLVMSC